VLLVGGDQSQLRTPLSDPAFTAFVHDAVVGAPVVMTDGGMTAAAGARYVANPDPTGLTRGDEGMADFRTGHNHVREGLGLVPGADFEPALTRDYRWGRPYGLSHADQANIVFGVCQGTALVLDPAGPTVAGDRSVVSLDGRTATFLNGSNGALSALNLRMGLFAPGDTVAG
jgi:cyanophycinase-like exopeptidase